ncbi:hypothetical protein DFH27DRAFT_612346 [Peziza echinospora]|nr:hypothetical protein DFH27DRAFT_612346 [Peziza echinospora]
MSDSDTKSKKDSVPLLKGAENFHTWFRRVKLKLAEKGLLKVSTFQDIPNGENQPAKDDFERCVRRELQPAELNKEEAEDVDDVRARAKEREQWEKKFYKATSYILETIHLNLQGEFN